MMELVSNAYHHHRTNLASDFGSVYFSVFFSKMSSLTTLRLPRNPIRQPEIHVLKGGDIVQNEEAPVEIASSGGGGKCCLKF